MKYYHVDVFSDRTFSGNGLAAVFAGEEEDAGFLQRITKEFNQFETVFIYPAAPDNAYSLRIFTREEELKFAGHPVMGACAVIHREYFSSMQHQHINIRLGERAIKVESENRGTYFHVRMNQGFPEYIRTIRENSLEDIALSLGLNKNDISEKYPVEVISTGLPYLLVPLSGNIEKAGISRNDFELFLERFKAKFVYVFDINTLECRTWDNSGNNEDIATGSAAGPLCAYLVKNGIRNAGEEIHIHQGKFAGRPSIIKCVYDRISNEITVSGDVSFFAEGKII